MSSGSHPEQDPVMGLYYLEIVDEYVPPENCPVSMCSGCGERPKYTNGNGVYPYCGGGTCTNPEKRKGSCVNSPLQTMTTRHAAKENSLPTSGGSLEESMDSLVTSFRQLCGPAAAGCLSCRTFPLHSSQVFCPPCYFVIQYTAPMIFQVPDGHSRYKSVESQFQQTWLHNTTCPEVRAIYKIVNSNASVAKYNSYGGRVEARRGFTLGRYLWNERRRWHGTTRMCNIGDPGVTEFCSNPSCSLCCIMRSSFDLSFFASRTNFGRFGAGIYISSASSKADAYSSNGRASNWKAMLLNKVIVGRGCIMTHNNKTLTKPPPGYDSVIGEVGGSLNYDELVIYDNDAIRPSYLVMYDAPTGTGISNPRR